MAEDLEQKNALLEQQVKELEARLEAEKAAKEVREGEDPENPEYQGNVDGRGRKSTLGIPYKSGTREYARAYYQRNKETMNERMRQYHKDHPEKARDAVRRYQEANPEKVKASQKNYRDKINAEHAEIKQKGNEEKPRFEDAFNKEGNNNGES